MSYLYYDQDGRPIDRESWILAFGDVQGRRIGWTKVGYGPGKKIVSTVWLGLDHRHFGEGPPIIFETMVFNGVGPGATKNDVVTCLRYATTQEAAKGHAVLAQEYLYNRAQRRRQMKKGQAHGDVQTNAVGSHVSERTSLI